MSKKIKSVAQVVADIGHETRRRINELPEKDRTMAWACIGAAVAAAGIHDSDEPEVIIDMINHAINAMVVGSFMQDQKERKKS